MLSDLFTFSKKKSCLLFCCQSSFSFCDILFYVGTEVKNPEHYTKKILKLTKKNSHWFYSSRKARNLKKNDLSPPKFTLKRKLHTEKSQIKPWIINMTDIVPCFFSSVSIFLVCTSFFKEWWKNNNIRYSLNADLWNNRILPLIESFWGLFLALF